MVPFWQTSSNSTRLFIDPTLICDAEKIWDDNEKVKDC
jgi:hypothetical protein